MSFENPNPVESNEDTLDPERREKREYHIYKDIQNVLIARTHTGVEDLDEHVLKWATGPDAVNFAAAFEGLKAENPNLLNDYDKDPEEVISAIQARMNYISTPRKRAA